MLAEIEKDGKTRVQKSASVTVELSNVRSVRSKTDELQAAVNDIHEKRNAHLLAFTETWLEENVHDNQLFIDGFETPVRLDRNSSATWKSHGGGLCLYVDRNWCNIVPVRDTLCMPDIELPTVSLRPFYSPSEFPQLFFTVVYSQPPSEFLQLFFTVVYSHLANSPSCSSQWCTVT